MHSLLQVTGYSSLLTINDRGFRLESALGLIFSSPLFFFSIDDFARKNGTVDILLCGHGAG